MNSPNPILAPLTPAEEAEIAEYERIVALAEQVMAGTHSCVKIPASYVSPFCCRIYRRKHHSP